MKTLDEVIEVLEDPCDVFTGPEEQAVLYSEDLEDALKYLKMYQSDLLQFEADRENWESHYRLEAEKFNKATEKHLLALKELKQKEAEFKEARDRHFTAYRILEERLRERNDPLTWEELTTMIGQPVWVEDDLVKPEGHWDIIRKVVGDRIAFYVQGMTNVKEWQGIAWQAYRKEHTERNNELIYKNFPQDQEQGIS